MNGSDMKDDREPNAQDAGSQVRPSQFQRSAERTEDIELFKAVDEACLEIFIEKNDKYDGAIHTTGVLGASVELIGATARLRPLVLKDPTHGKTNREDLINVLKDIHNYANIALMGLSKDNWDGK